jgi:hypothetical protein
MANSHQHGNDSSSREGRYALIVAFVTLLGTIVVPWYTSCETKSSERAALTAEAGFLCHAMSWQVVYLASDRNPGGWRDVGQDKLTAAIDQPEHAWGRPSWFPLRTPVWTTLKDRVGDLSGAESGTLVGFYNRAEFLDVLRRRRHCYTSSTSKSQFWHMYACTIKGELGTCSENDWGADYDPASGKLKSLATQYRAITDELENKLSCTKESGWATPTAGDSQKECDTDIAGVEGALVDGNATAAPATKKREH